MFLGDDFEVRLHGIHANDVVVLGEIHPVDASGVPAHRPHFRLAEENRLAFVAGQENHLLTVCELRADQLVLAIQCESDDAGRARI